MRCLPFVFVATAAAVPCFTEDEPPLCVGTSTVENAQDFCEDLETTYFGETFHDIVWNIDAHVDALSTVEAGTEECQNIRNYYHLCYWCTLDTDVCYDCTVPDQLDESIDVDDACDVLEDLVWDNRSPKTVDLCYQARNVAHLCDGVCGDSDDDDDWLLPDDTIIDDDEPYLGAATKHRKWSLVWVPRISSGLSLLMAGFMVGAALSNWSAVREDTYNQLVTAIAFCDMAFAGAWSAANYPLPVDDGSADYVQGASGSLPGCHIQAFVVHWGFVTVLLYHCSLFLYLVIRRKSILWHLIPVVSGTGVAFASLPFYDWNELICHFDISLGPNLALAFAPSALTLMVAFVCLLLVLCRRRKYSSSFRSVATRHLLVLLVCGPIWWSLFYIKGSESYVWSLAIAILSPLHGFVHAMVCSQTSLKGAGDAKHDAVDTSEGDFI